MSPAFSFPPPIPTPRQETGDLHFDVEVSDPYRWLEKDDDDVTAWSEAQDDRARQVLSNLPEREALATRLQELLYVESRHVPWRAGDRYFFSIRPRDQEKTIHYFREGLEGPAQVLLDPNTMSEDGSVSVTTVVPSEDGQWVAYQVHENAADSAALLVMEVDTRRVSEKDRIEGVRYTSPSWALDGSGFYYTWRPTDPAIVEHERSAFAEVRFHRLGTDPSTDITIFPATGDAQAFIGGHLSHDGKFLFVSIARGWSQTDVYLARMASQGAPEKPPAFAALVKGVAATFDVFSYEDQLFILTNEDAPRYRLMTTHAAAPEHDAWTELLGERPGTVLRSAGVVGGKLTLHLERDAYSELEVRNLDGSAPQKVPLPGIGSASSLIGREDDPEAYYAFSSFVHATEIRKLSVAAPEVSTLWSRVEVPAKLDEFEVLQEWATSVDGTRVPYFLVQKRGLPRTPRPTLLTGYGGFNISLRPSFSPSILPWLERDNRYVVANLRGGGEYGEAWHQAGMLANKQNVFDDFQAVSDALVKNALTTPGTLGIRGASNGGLLVGAAMVQHPESFGAVVCGVPLLDMVRFAKFGMGKAWVPEYGDPEEEQAFRTLLAYSPYHNVSAGVAYPPLLMESADTDDRVAPMHARKFAAAIEWASSAAEPRVLLRIEKQAGHGGADLRRKEVERLADQFAFLLSTLKQND